MRRGFDVDSSEIKARYYYVDETLRHRLSIGKELNTWGVEIPNLLARLGVASQKTTLPGRLRLELEIMARRINMQFNAIGEAANADTPDATNSQLLKNTDRLRELIAVANAALDLIPRVEGGRTAARRDPES